MPRDWVEPNVCIDEHLVLNEDQQLCLQPWSVPQLQVDMIAHSGGDGPIKAPIPALPGKLLINTSAHFGNDTPVDQMVLIRIIRAAKTWQTSNPNAIQFRDRWTYAVNHDPPTPYTSGIYNSQAGSAVDLGTNSVAEPNPGVQWIWQSASSQDEWTGPISPGDEFRLLYQAYVWTPPPWSNNSNKNKPLHAAAGGYTRIQLFMFPMQGTLVAG